MTRPPAEELPPVARAVEARLVKGFRDYLRHDSIARNRLVATVRRVFESYGFAPLETPAVEHLDVLLGEYGEEGTKTIFRLTSPEDEPVALRYDLTVPLARVVAQYPDLPRPFRRYQVAPVWRGDKPGPGRYREFIQFDIDTVGSSALAADVEIVAAALEAFHALGLKPLVRLSSRRLLNLLVAWAGVAAERATDVFRVLDKLDKQGLEAVRLELSVGRVDASGDRIPGLGLGAAEVERIGRFLALERTGRSGTIAALAELFEGTPELETVLGELREIDGQLVALGIGDDAVAIDPTLARGLSYYTGPIFEAVLPDAAELGSIFGGGRYDGLVQRFLGQAIPATGGSIGVDRLLVALDRMGLLAARAVTSEVLVTVLDPTLMPEYQRMARELRTAGIATELYLGDARGLKKQLAYADKLAIPVALLLGGDEVARGEVSVKDLAEGARHGGDTKGREEYLGARFGQRAVRREDLVATVRALLGRTETIVER